MRALNTMWRVTALAGVLFASAAAFLWVVTFSFPSGREGVPGPSAWPRVILGIAFLAAVYMIVDSFLGQRDERSVVDRGVILSSLGIAGTAAYLLFMPVVGYIPLTVLFLAAMMLILGIRSLWVVLGVSVGFTALIYVVFTRLVNVTFPEGQLIDLGWLGA